MSALEIKELIDSGDVSSVPVEDVQELFTNALRLYVAKRATEYNPFPPVKDNAITATEAAVVTIALLKSAQLELFELTLWNSFGRM